MLTIQFRNLLVAGFVTLGYLNRATLASDEMLTIITSFNRGVLPVLPLENNIEYFIYYNQSYCNRIVVCAFELVARHFYHVHRKTSDKYDEFGCVLLVYLTPVI
jgi:hypothetical protein